MRKNNTTLNKASTKQLERELNKRLGDKISELEQEKAKIDEKINKIAQFSTVSPVKEINKTTKKLVSKQARRMKKGTMKKVRSVDGKSLRTRLLEIGADGQVRSVGDFLTSLKQTNWKTSSEKPATVVAAALAAENSGFNRVEKGKYQIVIKIVEGNVNV